MKLLTTGQVAKILKVSERRVRMMINEGKIDAHRLGRDFAIEESAIKDVPVVGNNGKRGRPTKQAMQKAAKKAKRKADTLGV